MRRRCEVTSRGEQWALWLLAGRFASLITGGDMPEENYMVVLLSACGSHVLAQKSFAGKLDP